MAPPKPLGFATHQLTSDVDVNVRVPKTAFKFTDASPPDMVTFTCPRSDLKSQFLREQLATRTTIDIMSTTVSKYAVYDDWQTTGVIHTWPEISRGQSVAATVVSRGNDYGGLLACYNLGQTLRCPQFQTDLIQKIYEFLRAGPPFPVSAQANLAVIHQQGFFDVLTVTNIKEMIDLHGVDSDVFILSVCAAAHFCNSDQLRHFSSGNYPAKFKEELILRLGFLRKSDSHVGFSAPI